MVLVIAWPLPHLSLTVCQLRFLMHVHHPHSYMSLTRAHVRAHTHALKHKHAHTSLCLRVSLFLSLSLCLSVCLSCHGPSETSTCVAVVREGRESTEADLQHQLVTLHGRVVGLFPTRRQGALLTACQNSQQVMVLRELAHGEACNISGQVKCFFIPFRGKRWCHTGIANRQRNNLYMYKTFTL